MPEHIHHHQSNPPPPPRRRKSRGQGLLALLFSLAVAITLLYLLFFVIFTPLRIAGDSLSPNLDEGELVLVLRLSKYLKTPERGDIVLVHTKNGPMLKRIIALHGETVELVDGAVYINSCPLDEFGYAVSGTASLAPTRVEGAYYLLSDDRDYAADSRLIGSVMMDDIEGRLLLRILPFARLTLYA